MSSIEENQESGRNFLGLIVTAVSVAGIIALCVGTAHHVSKKMFFLKLTSWLLTIPYYKSSGYTKFSQFIVAWILYGVGIVLWLWMVYSFYRGRWQDTYKVKLDTFPVWWTLPFFPILIVLLMFFLANNGWLGLSPAYFQNCGQCAVLTIWSLIVSVGYLMQPLVYLPQLWLIRNVYKTTDQATYTGSPVKTNVRLYLLSMLIASILVAVIDLIYQNMFFQVTVISYGLTALILATPVILRSVCRRETGYFTKAGGTAPITMTNDNNPSSAKMDVELSGNVTTSNTASGGSANGNTINQQIEGDVGMSNGDTDPYATGMSPTNSGPGWSNIDAGPIPTSQQPPSASSSKTGRSFLSNPFGAKKNTTSPSSSSGTNQQPSSTTHAPNTSHDWDESWLT